VQQGDDLEVATAAMRGILRYRNTATVRVIAMLLTSLDETIELLKTDMSTLP